MSITIEKKPAKWVKTMIDRQSRKKTGISKRKTK